MRRCCLLLVCLLLLTGCGRADTQDVSSFAPAEGDRLVIFTSHKETIYEPILKEFEQRTGIWVELETGGTVTLLERIAAGESGADLMFGGGADSLSAYSACFAPYVSEYAGDVAPECGNCRKRVYPFSRSGRMLCFPYTCPASCKAAFFSWKGMYPPSI